MKFQTVNSCMNFDHFDVYTFKTGKWKENAYVIHDKKELSLSVIDPGGEEDKIIDLIDNLNTDSKRIILTHAHHDHVGGLHDLCEKYDLGFFLHRGDYKIFRRAPLFALSFEGRQIKIPKDRHVFLEEGDEGIVENGISFIHTPGHTEGGVVINFPPFSFTGDTLLNRLVGRTDLPGACPSLLSDSIEKFLNKLNENIVLFPGHGSPWTVKEAKKWWLENSDQLPEYRTQEDEL